MMRKINLLPAIVAAALAAAPSSDASGGRPEDIVRGFMQVVRSGKDPDAADRFFAEAVQAHQLTSEGETTVARTPAEYADHVREFKRTFGAYTFEVQEMIAQDDRVYVRWRQQGRHRGTLFGEAPSDAPLTEIGSAVYRIEHGRIVEYWIQLDRKGLELQLERARRAPGEPSGR